MISRDNYLLAIGIDDYEYADWNNLANAVRDTQALVDVLTSRYSFELIQEPLYNEQATRKNIYAAFFNALSTLTDEDNLIIFFAGHGFMHPLSHKGYWVPHEGRKNISDYISNSDIKDFIEQIPSKHIFLIADACFSGTFLSRTRGNVIEQYYTSLDSKVSRWMLASGGEETVSDGPTGQSSPFAKYLLKFLNGNTNKYASSGEIIKYVSALTTHFSAQKSRGEYISNIGHEGGELVLILNSPWVMTSYEATDGFPRTDALTKEIRAIYRRRSTISAGKEIFLVDSFNDIPHLFLIECFRFDDNGKKKLSFEKNKVKMPAKDNPDYSLKLLQRFATWEGFSRYWDSNQHLYIDREVHVIHASKEIEEVEETEAAIRQQEVIQDLLDANPTPMRCLHCQNMISTNDSYLVELDEVNENVGNVHAECLRPADRILGKSTFPNLVNTQLVNFDYQKWIDLRRKGQAFLNNAKKASEDEDVQVLVWNRAHNLNSGNYCINMILEDGSSRYLRLGKRIHRFNENEIDEEVAAFNLELKEAIDANDPLAITSENKVLAHVSRLEGIKSESEKILRIIKCEKDRYSYQLDSANEHIENDYAPLGLLLNQQHEIINFSNCIPLISDPTKMEELYANWNQAGFGTEKFMFKIIEDDKELDLYLIDFFANGMQPIIDPYFDENKELLQGTYISDIESLQDLGNRSQGKLNPDGLLKAGDRVKVVFPNVETDKFARGILLTDEFIGEDNISYVIFQPIEDGIVLENMKYKIQAQLMVKD
ncbi:caspase family protein [Chitinophaga sp. CF418]|uniref:caspase family protein n=1 Tax=Chitinophaga sp. CF418 TaxID=1855287 RepID=UPI0009150762|nr:caspase family protein [Chitinophaga sp. CF418]SHN41244.1 Caspase domain-containing protein [Chitinophaga sp. CF418]